MSSRQQTPILIALGIAFAVVFCAPILSDPLGAAIGVECGPGSRDLWDMWRALSSSATGGLGFPGAEPDGQVTVPTVWLLAQGLASLGAGPIAIWNTLFALGYVMLTLGCAVLGRRVSPNSPLVAQVTLMIAVVGSAAWSPLLRQLGTGMIPMMLVPLVLAEIHAWIQPDARRIHGVLAMTLFALACLGSWGSTALVMLMTPPMVVVVCQHIEGHHALRRSAAVLTPGLLLGAAHIFATHDSRPGLLLDAATLAPAWMTEMEGALVLPATASVALPSIGILLLALAGVASRPVTTAGWLLAATWGVLLAAADTSSALPVVHLIDTFGPLDALNGWWAVAPLVSIPLGMAAMRGVEALHRAQRDRLALGVLVLALMDQTLPLITVTGAQNVRPEPSPAMISALSELPDGGVLQLPATGEDCARADRHRLWQPILGRPVSTEPWSGSNGARAISYIARMADTLASEPPRRASHEAALETDVYRCAMQDVFTLRDLDFAAVSLDKTASAHPALDAALRMLLGEPVAEDEASAVWGLSEVDAGEPGEPCPLP